MEEAMCDVIGYGAMLKFTGENESSGLKKDLEKLYFATRRMMPCQRLQADWRKAKLTR